MAKRKPTTEAYAELQKAFDFYNMHLFKNRLPQCLITFQRKKRAYGYFSSNRWVSGRKVTDEIALNPDYFDHTKEGLTDVLSTLVHEMTHLEQHHFGTPGRGRYHNREWAGMMLAIGLHPSSTGAEGGKMTGDSVSHYIVKNGQFDVVTKELIGTGFKFSWSDSLGSLPPKAEPSKPELPPKKATRQKFSCPKCGLNAWAKYEAPVGCWKCKKKMRPVGLV